MDSEPTESNLHWYVLYTNPKQEERASKNLNAWQIETLAPLVKQRSYNSFTGEPYYTVKPLFPRYIFVKLDLEKLYHKVRFTRGGQDFICFGEGPVVIDERIIEIVRSRVSDDGFVRIHEGFKYGDKVRINEGPMKDFIGVFEREMNGPERVSILLNAVSYQARVEVTSAQLTKVAEQPASV